MSPVKNAYVTYMALGTKRFQIEDLRIDLVMGLIMGKVPEELEGDIKNLRKWMKKNRTIPMESQRKTRQRLALQKKRKWSLDK
jgi:hypothetical protein